MIALGNYDCLVYATAALGGVAQLARASALHAEGHRFDSVRLHQTFFIILFRYAESDVTKGLGFIIQTSTLVEKSA